MILSRSQIRTIMQNPKINSFALARLMGVKAQTITSFRFRRGLGSLWHYKGFGVPFSSFRGDMRHQVEIEFKKMYIASTNSAEKAFAIVDHLIWCIENGMFNAKPIEHPYREKLGFIK